MIVIESTGRKLKDAINNGLEQLGKTLTEVEVEVLDNGGLFHKAKVRITVQEDEPAPEIKTEPKPVLKQEQRPVAQKKPEPPAKEKPVEKKNEKPAKTEQKQEHRQERKPERQSERKQESKSVERKQEQKSENTETQPRVIEPATPEIAKKAEDFVTTLIEKMGLEASIDTTIEDGEIRINLTAEGSTLIGYHGEVLESVESLTSYSINRDHDKYYHIVVDCNNYRDKRRETLVSLANRMAARCLKVHHKVVLEPMNSSDRKIIHSTLADNPSVITRSEGHEPNRRVVILYKRR